MTGAHDVAFHEAAFDKGYFHLTPTGWVRRDQHPFPDERVETWRYEMEQLESDEKECDRLTRVWIDARASNDMREKLRARFGEAVAPRKDRRLTIQCDV
jgi:hypothetical protein